MEHSDLFRLGGPFILLADLPDVAFANLQLALVDAPQGAVVRMIRGRKCQTYHAFFDEVGAALQFPYYFGENWNAFNDCLTDLEWLPGNAYIFMFANVDRILSEEGREAFVALSQYLLRAGEAWRRTPIEWFPHGKSPRPFHALFHCNGAGLEMISERLRNAGVEYGRWPSQGA